MKNISQNGVNCRLQLSFILSFIEIFVLPKHRRNFSFGNSKSNSLHLIKMDHVGSLECLRSDVFIHEDAVGVHSLMTLDVFSTFSGKSSEQWVALCATVSGIWKNGHNAISLDWVPRHEACDIREAFSFRHWKAESNKADFWLHVNWRSQGVEGMNEGICLSSTLAFTLVLSINRILRLFVLLVRRHACLFLTWIHSIYSHKSRRLRMMAIREFHCYLLIEFGWFLCKPKGKSYAISKFRLLSCPHCHDEYWNPELFLICLITFSHSHIDPSANV